MNGTPLEAVGDWLVIGVGNPFRHDDGIGLVIAQRLREDLPAGVRVLEQSGDAFQLMEAWQGAGAVVVIDASSSGAPPGTIRCIDAATGPVPAQFVCCSSHAFGVAEAVELARNLGQLPPRVLIYAVEAAALEPGTGLSAPVAAAVDEVVRQVTAVVVGAPAAANPHGAPTNA